MFNINQLTQMMSNPIMKTLIDSNNPKEVVNNILKQNPQLQNVQTIQNVVRMMNSGDYNSIEQMGKNLVIGQGGNPDEIINMVKNMSK